MEFEEEVFYLLIGGFILVMIIVTIIITYLWKATNNIAYKKFIWQSIWLCVSFFFLLQCLFPYKLGIETDPAISIPSISNSVNICLSGIAWAFSMVCFVDGIHKLK